MFKMCKLWAVYLKHYFKSQHETFEKALTHKNRKNNCWGHFSRSAEIVSALNWFDLHFGWPGNNVRTSYLAFSFAIRINHVAGINWLCNSHFYFIVVCSVLYPFICGVVARVCSFDSTLLHMSSRGPSILLSQSLWTPGLHVFCIKSKSYTQVKPPFTYTFCPDCSHYLPLGI